MFLLFERDYDYHNNIGLFKTKEAAENYADAINREAVKALDAHTLAVANFNATKLKFRKDYKEANPYPVREETPNKPVYDRELATAIRGYSDAFKLVMDDYNKRKRQNVNDHQKACNAYELQFERAWNKHYQENCPRFTGPHMMDLSIEEVAELG